jgi:hypothetical protein
MPEHPAALAVTGTSEGVYIDLIAPEPELRVGGPMLVVGVDHQPTAKAMLQFRSDIEERRPGEATDGSVVSPRRRLGHLLPYDALDIREAHRLLAS